MHQPPPPPLSCVPVKEFQRLECGVSQPGVHLYVVEELGACREKVPKHRPQGSSYALTGEAVYPGVNATLGVRWEEGWRGREGEGEKGRKGREGKKRRGGKKRGRKGRRERKEREGRKGRKGRKEGGREEGKGRMEGERMYN